MKKAEVTNRDWKLLRSKASLKNAMRTEFYPGYKTKDEK
jgi:hypothetical protein